MVVCVVRQYRRLSGALAGSGSSASRTRFEGCVYQRHPQCRRVVTTFLHVCIDIINYSLPVLLKYQRKYLMLLLWDLKSYLCQTTGLFCGSGVYQVMAVKMGGSNSFPESSKAEFVEEWNHHVSLFLMVFFVFQVARSWEGRWRFGKASWLYAGVSVQWGDAYGASSASWIHCMCGCLPHAENTPLSLWIYCRLQRRPKGVCLKFIVHVCVGFKMQFISPQSVRGRVWMCCSCSLMVVWHPWSSSVALGRCSLVPLEELWATPSPRTALWKTNLSSALIWEVRGEADEIKQF